MALEHLLTRQPHLRRRDPFGRRPCSEGYHLIAFDRLGAMHEDSQPPNQDRYGEPGTSGGREDQPRAMHR